MEGVNPGSCKKWCNIYDKFSRSNQKIGWLPVQNKWKGVASHIYILEMRSIEFIKPCTEIRKMWVNRICFTFLGLDNEFGSDDFQHGSWDHAGGWLDWVKVTVWSID